MTHHRNPLTHITTRALTMLAGMAVMLCPAIPVRAADVLPPPLQGGADKNASIPAEAAPVIELAAPAEGVTLVYRIADPDGRERTERWTVLADGTHKGRPVARLGNGSEIQLLDPVTRNWIATLRDGQEVAAVEPHGGVWSWPLEVGRRWQSDFVLRDRARNLTVGPVGTEWIVEAFERVKTPAGSFPAMRLRGEPGRSNTRRTYVWYAPELRVMVRREVEQAGAKRGEKRVSVTELIDYAPR